MAFLNATFEAQAVSTNPCLSCPPLAARSYATASTTVTKTRAPRKSRSSKTGTAKQSAAENAEKPSSKPKPAVKKVAATEKPASKKAPAAKKKPAVKKKPALKKKPAMKKKSATKKKTSKKLTESEAILAKVKLLHGQALREFEKLPTLPTNKYVIYLLENGLEGGGEQASAVTKRLSGQWRNVSASEKEHLSHVATQNQIANEEMKKAWIEKHQPEEIYNANVARNQLTRISKLGIPEGRKHRYTTPLRKINDPRIPKQPMGPVALYLKEKFASEGKAVRSRAESKSHLGNVSKEFKALDENEKQKYHAEAKLLRDEYLNQRKSILPQLSRRSGL